MGIIFWSISGHGQTSGILTVSVTTSSTGGNYAPKNVVAIWIEDYSGKFVKTLLEYGDKRKTYLNSWETSTAAAGLAFNTADAVTGATTNSHGARACAWDGTDFNQKPVPDGEYRVRMELTDKNAMGNTATFTFQKGPNHQSVSPPNVPGFSSVTLNWTVATAGITLKKNASREIQLLSNPGAGKFTVIAQDILSLTVTSLTGRVVCVSQNPLIDLSDQPTGVYFLTIKTAKQTQTQKIIKN